MTTLNVNVVSANGRSLVTVVGSGPAGVAGAGVPSGGTAGQALTKIDATAFNTQWSTLFGSRSRVILTDVAQSIPNAVATDITWSTEVVDLDGWTAGAIANLTVPAGKDGQYLISYTGVWAGVPGTLYGAALFLNGVVIATCSDVGLWNTSSLTTLRTLVAGDVLKVQVFHNNAALNIVSRLEITG